MESNAQSRKHVIILGGKSYDVRIPAVIFLENPSIEDFQQILSFNGDLNRPRDAQHVAFIRKMAESGHWIWDGEPYRIDTNCQLFDGQHRSEGIAMAITKKLNVPICICLGCHPDSYLAQANVRGRNIGVTFRQMDVRNPNLTIATCTLLIRGFVTQRTDKIPADVYMEFFARNRASLQEGFLYAQKSKQGDRLLKPSAAAALFFLFAKKDHGRAELFLNYISNELAVQGRTPAAALFRSIRNRDFKTKHRRRAHEIFALCIKAWNHKDSACEALQWREKGGEPFPEIK